MLVEARGLIDRFQAVVRTKAASELDDRVTEASASLIASFASDITRDQAAMTKPWSNGQAEG